jgi:hypothetical protein
VCNARKKRPVHESKEAWSSTTILGGLMSGPICMFEVLFSVCCVFDPQMMIQTNGVFVLMGGVHFHGIH